ncbi:hypothetical protein V5O48_012346 [Marasmius crinis-equi]|uniref:Uncharacterized protein n=1 Tax=Marasmius crinis-equi TaxID=585013 RepID=A0ABR3F360_9AGAR
MELLSDLQGVRCDPQEGASSQYSRPVVVLSDDLICCVLELAIRCERFDFPVRLLMVRRVVTPTLYRTFYEDIAIFQPEGLAQLNRTLRIYPARARYIQSLFIRIDGTPDHRFHNSDSVPPEVYTRRRLSGIFTRSMGQVVWLIKQYSPLPLAIALSTAEQAKFVAEFMRDFVKGFQSMSYTDIRCSFDTWADLDQLSGYVRSCDDRQAVVTKTQRSLYVDVRSGWRPGVYCVAKDAFDAMLLEANHDRHRAFAFDTFKDAMLSHVVGSEYPTNAIYEYNPTTQSRCKLILYKYLIQAGYRTRYIASDADTLDVSTGESTDSDAPRSDTMSSGSEDDITIMANAEDAVYNHACEYLKAHGYAADEVKCVTSLYDVGCSRRDFVARLEAKLGRVQEHKEYEYVFGLLGERSSI